MTAPLFVLPPVLERTVDVILRSSDGIDFRTHQMLLAAASSAFESTFLLPTRPRAPDDTDLSSVELVESGEVIALMLTYIYPMEKSPPSSFTVLKGTLRAAKKYDMLPVISGLRSHLLRPDLLRSHPLGVYGIASSIGLLSQAQTAHRRTLEVSLTALLRIEEDAEDLSGIGLARLLKHRQLVAAQMVAIVDRIEPDSQEPPPYSIPRCHGMCLQPFEWVGHWKTFCEATLERQPSTELPFTWGVLECYRKQYCGCYCSPRVEGGVWEFGSVLLLKKDLDQVVEEELGKLDWSKSAPF